MRKFLSEYINNCYFLHADMFNTIRFPFNESVKVINTGLGEANLLNIASGIASQNNTVFIYGVCGFIIHRFEQLKFSCKNFGALNGKIIICNAGKYGYEDFGIGHKLDDDLELMKILNIKYFVPKDLNDFKNILDSIKTNGVFYIQLGKDISR